MAVHRWAGGAWRSDRRSLSAPRRLPILLAMSDETSLTNHQLIAMPSLLDPNFSQPVALICDHPDKGALGIVVNKPMPMRLQDVLEQMNLEAQTPDIASKQVLRGGPVSTDRGFVLH